MRSDEGWGFERIQLIEDMDHTLAIDEALTIGDRVAAASSRGHRIPQVDGRLGNYIAGAADSTRAGGVFDFHLFVIDKHERPSPALTDYQHDDVDRFIVISDLPGQNGFTSRSEREQGPKSPRITRYW